MKRLAVLALALACPALAQPAPPPAAEAPRAKPHPFDPRAPVFGRVSPEGRQILSEAMNRNRAADREALKAARDRINSLIAADRLDLPALRRAMEEERRLVDRQHAERQAALLEAVQKLSAADRKAFAEDALAGRRRAEARAESWRRWADEFRRRMKDSPPPVAPPPPPGSAGSVR
ncbi:periplasmic heavy metal sensor [Thermaurantiacus sp.]